ncbi:hypothetical protein NUW54_g13757 [Trametes sanguinea]|uniref:Uncharacterized protein n=1 Tax=Trametes sanguinea TaxID=158606 RepID=A0ACC1MIW3_9APHY|nr:hypothetical protein NUW54_g13757 [Trametes sanguinea]
MNAWPITRPLNRQNQTHPLPASTTSNHVHSEVQLEDADPEQDNEDSIEYNPAKFDDFEESTGLQDEDLKDNIDGRSEGELFDQSNGETSKEEDAGNLKEEASWEPPVQPSSRPQTQVEEADDDIQDVPTGGEASATQDARRPLPR